MNKYESDYFELLKDIISNGKKSSNRTGINTIKVWGRQTRIDLSKGFPLLTTKKIHWKSVVHELLWMISGDTNIQYLLKNGVTFWSEWPYQRYFDKSSKYLEKYPSSPNQEILSIKDFEKKIVENDIFAQTWGSIGNFGYGRFWRDFPVNSYEDRDGGRHKILGVDQVCSVLEKLKTNPDSRRIIISAWHPYHSNRVEDALLPACHNYIQFGTEELTWDERNYLYIGKMGGGWAGMTSEDYDYAKIPKYRLNCYYSMRSSDVPLGMPYNVAFYALFTHLISHCLNMVPGTLIHNAADVHIYENQIDGIKEQLSRSIGKLPTVKIKDSATRDIFSIKYEDIELVGYNPQPAILIPVTV